MIKIILPFIIIVVVLVGGYFSYKQITQTTRNEPTPASIPTPSPSPTTQELKTFQSSNVMKFSIGAPNDYQVEEKLGSVTLSAPDGKIYIDKSGTNFDNLEDYLKDLSIKNNFVLKEKKNLSINGMSTVGGYINGEKIYFIYIPNRVYTLSTKTQQLYSDLDQIAQSFRYIP